jgi:hypothetical protein
MNEQWLTKSLGGECGRVTFFQATMPAQFGSLPKCAANELALESDQRDLAIACAKNKMKVGSLNSLSWSKAKSLQHYCIKKIGLYAEGGPFLYKQIGLN